jgi:TP901 family phage tail tape measure protein
MFDAGSIVGRMTLDLNKWSRAVENVRKDTNSMKGWILRNQAQVTQMGRSFMIAGAAMTTGYALAAKSAISFESAFAGVRKTVDATEKEYAKLEKNLIDLSNQMPMAASGLAGIMEIAGQLGVRGVEGLTKFTETVAKISVTTNLTKEAAATDFARIANIMQEPLTNVDRMGASIVDLGNNFATTEAEISSFAQRIAGSAKVVGLTTPDIFAIGTAFSSVGVRAERGGTAVSKALVKIGESIKTGNEELKTFASVSGMTVDEFTKAFEKDAGKAFAIFIEGLGRGGLQAAKILEELELGDQRLKQAFLSVGGASGILTEALEKSSKAWEKNIALVEEAQKRFDTTGSILKVTWNTVTNLATKIGDLLLPAIQKLSNMVTTIAIRLQKWIDNNKTLATVLTYLGSVLGLTLIALGGLAIALPGIISAMIIFQGAVHGATISVLGFNLALGPIILTTLGITAALIAALVVFYKWETIIASLKIAWWSFAEGVNTGLADLTEGLANWIAKMEKVPWIGEKFKNTADGMRKTVDGLRKSAEECGERTVEAFNEMDNAADNNIVGDIVDKTTGAIDKLKKEFGNMTNDGKASFERLTEFGKQAARNIEDAFGTFFYDAFKGQLKTAQDYFSAFGDAILQTLAQIAAYAALTGLFGSTKFGSWLGWGSGGTAASAAPAGPGPIVTAQEGLEEVPYTGAYKLHSGEQVVPAYDAGKKREQAIEIHNYITPEAVAMAMSGREGEGVIVNIINRDSLRNGIIRRETVRR